MELIKVVKVETNKFHGFTLLSGLNKRGDWPAALELSSRKRRATTTRGGRIGITDNELRT